MKKTKSSKKIVLKITMSMTDMCLTCFPACLICFLHPAANWVSGLWAQLTSALEG